MTLEEEMRTAEWREEWRQYESKLAEKWRAVIRSGIPIECHALQEIEEARKRRAKDLA